MHTGHYIFTQIIQFLPRRQFWRILDKYDDRTLGWSFTHWNQLLVLMFGQFLGCGSLRELTDITTAHSKRSYNLGFGASAVVRNTLAKANMLREPRIFEEFAFYMVSLAQRRRITKKFELHGRFYAVDSTTIDLCMSIFRWALFRSTKSGIKVHTQIDIITEIPVFYRITNAKDGDCKAMDWIEYESNACYIFDRGYFDLARLFRIHLCGAFFVIREKGKPKIEIVDGEDMLDGEDGVLLDQTVRFSGRRNSDNYPTVLRRIVYYAADLGRSFVYYTNNFYLAAKDIALLYRYRWQVELFFKWIKQHLRVKRFWGDSENAVRIQIHVAIITYCLVAIIEHDIEHDLKLDRPVFEVMRVLGCSLLVKDNLMELFRERQGDMGDSGQLELKYDC